MCHYHHLTIWAVVPNNSTQTIGIWIEQAILVLRAKRDCHTLWCKKKTHSNESWTFSAQRKKKDRSKKKNKNCHMQSKMHKKKRQKEREKCHATIPSCRHTQEACNKNGLSLRALSVETYREGMFYRWLDPCSLAASKGILVSFFSLRLLICLSSARSLAWAEVKKDRNTN